jgi:hypothetical protein
VTRKTVFISYSHKDEDWKNLLRPHLEMLEQLGLIKLWDDRRIDPGGAWFQEIRAVIGQAAISICLISADYLASSFCTKEEIPYLLRRQAKEGMVLIVVLCRQCAWKAVPWLRSIQFLPRDGKSVGSDYRDDPDRIFSEVAEQIARYLDEPDISAGATVRSVSWPKPEQVDITQLHIADAEIFGREPEVSLLGGIWEKDQIRLVTLVAWGGTGKSRLVQHWLNEMGEDNFRGADRIYAWSFSNQGTTDQRCTIDEFMTAALAWFGDNKPSSRDHAQVAPIGHVASRTNP